jgi:hypothetical protein
MSASERVSRAFFVLRKKRFGLNIMGFCQAGIVIVVLLWTPALSLLPTVEGFHLKWTPYTKGPATTKFRFRNDSKIIPESRSCCIETQHHRFFGSDAFATTTTTSTSLKMMVENTKDPDFLLQMVEELAMEEFTPDTMAKMEEVEIALANFLDEISAALLEQEQHRLNEGRPKPSSIPPPGSLLEMEDSDELQMQQSGWQQQQDRDLATDLAKAGTALELLQQLLRSEEEAVLEEERDLQSEYIYEEQQYESTTFDEQQEYFEEQQQESTTTFDEQDVLFQAEEALRKSKEAAEKRRLEAERRSITAARVSAGYRRQQMQEQEQQQQQQQQQQHQEEEEQLLLRQDQPVTETFGTVDPYGEENTPSQNQQQGGESEDDFFPRTKRRATIELGSLFGKRGTGESVPEIDSRVPEGVPILSNWVQDKDGSITGNIRGSMNFRDGAKISTSCVSKGAREGTTIATQSGSR